MRMTMIMLMITVSGCCMLNAQIIENKSELCQQILKKATNKILTEYDAFLVFPDQYRKRVEDECSVFPEGEIYPYLLPAMAYANLAIRHPKSRLHCLKQMETLIDLAIPNVAKRVGAPKGNLLKLRSYKKHATFLATLNIALSNYALLCNGKNKYKKLFNHLSDLLYRALGDVDGKSIQSYPEYSWNFDTMFALVSLKLQDQVNNTTRAETVIRKHLDWLDKYASDKKTGLVYSIGNDQDGAGTDLPRGCDLSMRICLLAQLDQKRAEKMYKNYVKHHWVLKPQAAGFSEWPKGMQQNGGDVDSGPIIFEIGLTGTGVALGTVQAMNDQKRLAILCAELGLVESLLKFVTSPIARKMIPKQFKEWSEVFAMIDPQYFTGFLYGDAALFYALTWVKYPIVARTSYSRKK